MRCNKEDITKAISLVNISHTKFSFSKCDRSTVYAYVPDNTSLLIRFYAPHPTQFYLSPVNSYIHFLLICFIVLCRYCLSEFKLKVCSNLALNNSAGTIFPKAFAHFIVFASYFSNSHNISNFFIIINHFSNKKSFSLRYVHF